MTAQTIILIGIIIFFIGTGMAEDFVGGVALAGLYMLAVGFYFICVEVTKTSVDRYVSAKAECDIVKGELIKKETSYECKLPDGIVLIVR